MYSLKAIHIAGGVFTLIVGSLLHFVWEWSGYSDLTAVFSAVNESTWEHLKLIFVPFVVFSVYEYARYGKHTPCFFAVKARSVLLGMMTIITVFYTYTGILGENYFMLDISTFVLGVVISYLYSYRHMTAPIKPSFAYTEPLAVCVLLVIMAAFTVFTFVPPAMGLFRPPEF